MRRLQEVKYTDVAPRFPFKVHCSIKNDRGLWYSGDGDTKIQAFNNAILQMQRMELSAREKGIQI